MAQVKIRLNSAAFREFLNSGPVADYLQAEGEQVQARAESFTKQRAGGMRNPDYVTRTVTGGNRAVCYVWAANVNSFLAEVHDRALSKAAAQ